MTDTDIPTHLEDTLRTIAGSRLEHDQNATPLQRAVDRITALLGRPGSIGVLTVIIAGWVGFNLITATFGHRPVDPPPFSLLGTAITLMSFYVVVLILVTQRREDQIAQHREQLIIELVILGEQKTAKVIQLLEESRRDNPLVRDRVDQEADDMAQPVDPSSVLHAIKDIHAGLQQSADSHDGGKSDNANIRTSADVPIIERT